MRWRWLRAKRLFIEHANLKSGEFNQRSTNRMLRGGICGILNFGNVGVATVTRFSTSRT